MWCRRPMQTYRTEAADQGLDLCKSPQSVLPSLEVTSKYWLITCIKLAPVHDGLYSRFCICLPNGLSISLHQVSSGGLKATNKQFNVFHTCVLNYIINQKYIVVLWYNTLYQYIFLQSLVYFMLQQLTTFNAKPQKKAFSHGYICITISQ